MVDYSGKSHSLEQSGYVREGDRPEKKAIAQLWFVVREGDLLRAIAQLCFVAQLAEGDLLSDLAQFFFSSV